MGRLTVARAALVGALQGALLGASSACSWLIFTCDPNPAVPLLVL
jgi:hypothetical protein